MLSIRIHHGGKFQRYPGRIYVSGRVDIFDRVAIDLFTVVALNMMVLKLGYTGELEPMFYNYLRPFTSLDEGLYALACEEVVRCLDTLVRSFKLIEVYIEHGVSILGSYLRAPRFRTTLEDITNEPAGSIAANRTEKILLLTWHESSETTKKHVCDSVTPSPLPQHDSSTPYKDSVYESIIPRCLRDCILTPPGDESVIDYVIRQSSFDETKLDGEAGFVDVAGSGMDYSGLSHDESFGVDDLDLNLNEPVNLNVSQVETQFELPVFEEPDVEVNNEAPIMKEVGTQEFSVEDVVIEDYVSFEENAEHGKDDDDDVDKDFLVDEENVIVKPDVDVHLFGISMDLSFDNIGITNLVSDDILEGEDVDVINTDGFDSNPGNDEEKNYRKRRRMTLKLYKNDSVMIRARCKGKVHVFTMSQGTGPTGLNRGMKAGPSGSSGPTTRSKKRKNTVRVNPDIPVKAVQDQLQRELESTNPNTTVKIAVEKNIDPSLPTRMFQRIYVYLGELKLGFRACRRDLLGLDGAFMKGPFRGQVLCLGDDIYVHPNLNFTLISDRQNPSAEQIYCLLHLDENMKQGWCGQAYKDLLGRAASATNVRDFKKCRAKSDLLPNNICEVFNGIPCKHVVASCWNMALNDWAANLDKGTDVMKDKVGRKILCEEAVSLNKNIGKQIGHFVDMPSEAVEQGMDDIVPDEIAGAKGEQVPNHVVKKDNLEFLVCKEVTNPGVNELVDKRRSLKRKRVYAE
nr:hypothetical protein [Tanacetum cinerariifolium]GEW93216.1 hypothetical protein [Tanacetum cinerariifolium]